MEQLHLVKKDINTDSLIEIATYHNTSIDGWPYIICKNDKRIGWALEEQTALEIHDMYARIHILHETDDDPNYNEMIKKMRSRPQNNEFLHDFPNEEVAEKRKFFFSQI